MGIDPGNVGRRHLEHLGKKQVLAFQLTLTKPHHEALVEDALPGGTDLEEHQALFLLEEEIASGKLAKEEGS